MCESEKWKWRAQSGLTLRNPVDCSLPGSSVHGIFQARVLEWGAITFSGSHCYRCLKVWCDDSRIPYVWREKVDTSGESTKFPSLIMMINNSKHLTDISEKVMAPHSSTFAWKILWTEEPGRLQSMGSGRVGHDWVTSLSLFTFTHWRRKRQLTPVFLPGESQGRRSLVGCRLWGRTESDTTEAT